MIEISVTGPLRKMSARLDTEHAEWPSGVSYRMLVGEHEIEMNPLLGRRIRFEYMGTITCTHCGRKTRKSFSQGYCYPCFQSLAQCDSCIVRPERCHHDAGTCREPAWGEQYCHQPHVVSLANSSGIKVGITRGTQVPTRWIDQGGVHALPIVAGHAGLRSGLVEVMLKQHVPDKTNWRAMLKGQIESLDLAAQRDRLLEACAGELEALQQSFGLQAIQPLRDADAVAISYPVLQHPDKVVSLDFEKTPTIEGQLLGIKGQYLMLDTGVINIRKFGAYHVNFSAA